MRILAATDGSDAGTRTVEFAARLTKGLRGQLRITNVVSLRDIPLEQLDEYSRLGQVTRPEAMTAESRERLKSARLRVEALGIPDVPFESTMELHEGNVAETIIDAARRDEADEAEELDTNQKIRIGPHQLKRPICRHLPCRQVLPPHLTVQPLIHRHRLLLLQRRARRAWPLRRP